MQTKSLKGMAPVEKFGPSNAKKDKEEHGQSKFSKLASFAKAYIEKRK